MDENFLVEKLTSLKSHIDARFNGLENRMDGLEKRMETTEKLLQKMWIEVEAIRTDIRLIAEGHVMLNEKFGRFESEYI